MPHRSWDEVKATAAEVASAVIREPVHHQPELPLELPEPLTDTLEELRQANASRYQALISAGLMPDPRAVLSIRLDCLLELLLPFPDERRQFDIAFEKRMSAFLDDCDRQRTRAGLLAPAGPAAPPPAGLIVPRH